MSTPAHAHHETRVGSHLQDTLRRFPLPNTDRKTEIFIIGAPKCATSAVAHALSLHPQIAFCRYKEPRYFSNEGTFARGLDWYQGLFGDTPGLRAEASTSYGDAWMERRCISAERIHAYNPSARIIYCVRDPVQRAISEWREISHQLRIHNPYIERNYGIRFQASVDADLQSVPGYLDTSNYWKTVEIYRRYFDDAQIHIVFLEDWARAPDLELTRVLRFIDIDDRFKPPSLDAVINDKWVKAKPRLHLSLARLIPGYRSLALSAPRELTTLMQPFLKHHPDSDIGISKETMMIARRRLGADIDRFLEWRGVSSSYWKW